MNTQSNRSFGSLILKIGVGVTALLIFCCGGLFSLAFIDVIRNDDAPTEVAAVEVKSDNETSAETIEEPKREVQSVSVDAVDAAEISAELTESVPTETAEPTPEPTQPPKPTATSTQVPTATLAATSPPTSTPTLAPTHTPEPTTTLPPTVTLPPTATDEPSPTVPAGEIATVHRIIDGDTIDVNLNGEIVRVRYIGIDTPEYDEACGSEATQANANLIYGQTLRLVKDVSETDQFGRLLRYVYVDDLFVNGELVRDGWAKSVHYPPDTAQASLLDSLDAQSTDRTCAAPQRSAEEVPLPSLPEATPTPPPPAPEPTQPPPQPTQPPAPTQPPQNCDPSYPTVCIPPAPPDLDCGDIPFRRFQVLQPDPHRFDGDKDGIGCES